VIDLSPSAAQVAGSSVVPGARDLATSPGAIVAIDAGDLGLGELEHRLLGLLPALGEAVDACTHIVLEAPSHYGATIALVEPADPAELLAECCRLQPEASVAAWSASGTGIVTAGREIRAGDAAEALAARRDRRGGRAVRFGGQDCLTGTVTVEHIFSRTDIEAVDALGLSFEPDTPVVTRDFVRPTFRNGRLVLVLRPRAGGLGCFEQPDPTPCCSGH
jgi:hypothetical protein